ncbi:MAG: peptidoglycan DD-metalloendopeptidase family protein [Clostridia bacterium]|nr:peptidoglycan DD-metalloendopeptidase family protein [Clostridia bacterium]
MRKKIMLCVCLIINIIGICLFATPESNAIVMKAEAATAAELKAKQASLEAEQATIKSKISQLEANQASAQEQVNAISDLIDNIESQITTVNEKIAVQEAEIADLQAEIDAKEDEINESYEKFKSRVRAMYITGDITGGMEILLSAGDFEGFLSTMTYIEIMSEHDDAIVAALTEDKEGFQSQKALVEDKKAEVEAEKAILSVKKEELDEQKAQADALLSQIAADKAVLQEEQIKIDKEMQSARAALDAIINAAAANSTETDYVGGSWKWPSPGYGRVTSKFGWRSWSQSYHKGIDIGAPTGANIVASNAGTVVTSSYNAGGYGNYVIIDHGGGYMTVYGHLSRRSVSVGQKVGRGQVIGLCGSTGRSTGPHLHFEIRVNGTAQNPLNYL